MRLLAAATATAFLALCGTASAVIIPQRGMIGVELGDSVSEVRQEAGAPDGIVFVDNEIIGRQRLYRYGRTWVAFNGDDPDSTVSGITTRSRRERMANGVGVGTPRREVARKVKRAKCVVEFGFDHCYIGSYRPGTRVTDFRIGPRGRVRSITIGFVID